MSHLDLPENDDVEQRLLQNSTTDIEHEINNDEISQSQPDDCRICRLLYTSHFLSAWNSRAFEFGAFLFLATIYPQTLLPASIYALARAASAAIFSSQIGRFIDRADRLHVVRISIIGQRVSVAISCGLLYLLILHDAWRHKGFMAYASLAVLSALACAEKLSAVLNTISIERDWVTIIAGSREDDLRDMNSQMRRIDLFCKLVAPLFVSLIDTASSRAAIATTGLMTAASVLVEYFAIARVYRTVPALQAPKSDASSASGGPFFDSFRDAVSSAGTYFRHKAFLPSFSLALLYLTVLSFSGQMITYLLAIHVPSGLIGILRGVSALFEISATWIAPLLMRYVGPIRSGIWFINWQIFCVSAACVFFWLDLHPVTKAAGTISAVVASRIGLWGFDLSAQVIVQEEVEPELRGTFSSQEFAFQNVFEMLSFTSTIAFSRPSQFKIPATISAAAVGMAGVLYAAFVRSRRGHLVHFSNCVERHGKGSPQEGNGRGQEISEDEECFPGVERPLLLANNGD